MRCVFLSKNAPAKPKHFQAAPVVEKWPLWATAMALMKKDEDKGVGDTVHRVIGPSNSAEFKRWYLVIFGKSCGCERRQGEWNAQFPYNQR